MQDGHPILAPDEIKQRCRAIGLSPEQLAHRARVAPSTVSRLGFRDTRVSKLKRLTAALLDYELEQMRALIARHPAEAMAALCPERRP